MNNTNWVKITTLKLFNKPFFTKEEICKEASFEGVYQFFVTPEYYKAEFEDKKKNES